MRTEINLRPFPRKGASINFADSDSVNGNFIAVPRVESGSILLCLLGNILVSAVTVLTNKSLDGRNSEGLRLPNRTLTTTIGNVFLWDCPLVGNDAIYQQDDGSIYLDFNNVCLVSAYLMS